MPRRRHSSHRAGAGLTHRVDPAGIGRGSENRPKSGVQVRDFGRMHERPKTAHRGHRHAGHRRARRSATSHR